MSKEKGKSSRRNQKARERRRRREERLLREQARPAWWKRTDWLRVGEDVLRAVKLAKAAFALWAGDWPWPGA